MWETLLLNLNVANTTATSTRHTISPSLSPSPFASICLRTVNKFPGRIFQYPSPVGFTLPLNYNFLVVAQFLRKTKIALYDVKIKSVVWQIFLTDLYSSWPICSLVDVCVCQQRKNVWLFGEWGAAANAERGKMWHTCVCVWHTLAVVGFKFVLWEFNALTFSQTHSPVGWSSCLWNPNSLKPSCTVGLCVRHSTITKTSTFSHYTSNDGGGSYGTISSTQQDRTW